MNGPSRSPQDIPADVNQAWAEVPERIRSGKTLPEPWEGLFGALRLDAGKCVTIQYNRQRGFVNAEFVGFKMFNDVGSPMYTERSATSLKFTFQKDYPEIIKASQEGISRMRRTLEPPQKSGQ